MLFPPVIFLSYSSLWIVQTSVASGISARSVASLHKEESDTSSRPTVYEIESILRREMLFNPHSVGLNFFFREAMARLTLDGFETVDPGMGADDVSIISLHDVLLHGFPLLLQVESFSISLKAPAELTLSVKEAIL